MSEVIPRRPAPRDVADREDEGTTPSVWILIWTIYAAKILTIVLVIWAAHSYQTAALVAATTWPWLAGAIAFGIGPLLFQLRLRRVRAKQDRLKLSEWMVPTQSSLTPKRPV